MASLQNAKNVSGEQPNKLKGGLSVTLKDAISATAPKAPFSSTSNSSILSSTSLNPNTDPWTPKEDHRSTLKTDFCTANLFNIKF